MSRQRAWPPPPELLAASVMSHFYSLLPLTPASVNAAASANKINDTTETDNDHLRIAEAFILSVEEIKNMYPLPHQLYFTYNESEEEPLFVPVASIIQMSQPLPSPGTQSLVTTSGRVRSSDSLPSDEEAMTQGSTTQGPTTPGQSLVRKQSSTVASRPRHTRQSSFAGPVSFGSGTLSKPPLLVRSESTVDGMDALTQALCDLSLALRPNSILLETSKPRSSQNPQNESPNATIFSAEAMARRFFVACVNSSVDADATEGSVSAALMEAMRSSVSSSYAPAPLSRQLSRVNSTYSIAGTINGDANDFGMFSDEMTRQRAFSRESFESVGDAGMTEITSTTNGNGNEAEAIMVTDSAPKDTWPQPRMQLYYEIHRNRQVDPINRSRCYNCGERIDGMLRGGRYCEYTGKYYCRTCHNNDTSMIPARILHTWDFRPYRVCIRAKAFIENIWEEPILDLSVFNPTLYDKIKPLKQMMMMRTQLSHIREYVMTCRTCVDTNMLQTIFGDCMHLVNSIHHYSLQDMFEVESGTLTEFVMTNTTRLIDHIYNCQICRERGFVCEFCNNNKKILFPFQLQSVIQCPSCKWFFHTECWNKYERNCPRCMRIEGYRLRNLAQQRAVTTTSTTVAATASSSKR